MDSEYRIWLKKCRVCNKEGSRNIFDKITRLLDANSLQSVSSVDKLLEKLRFVTLIKIDEFDNKPKMLCDLCIIQLNVAYQFKALALEMDGRHQQYMIENGINLSPSSENSTLQCFERRALERSAATLRPITFSGHLTNIPQRRIKSEQTDYEIMSDISIDTNTDLIEDFARNGINSRASNRPPLGTSNMVCVSDLDLLRSNGDSDIEFINNCLPSMAFHHFENPPNSMESHKSTTTTTTTTTQLVIAASKPIVNPDKSSQPVRNASTTTSDSHKPHESLTVSVKKFTGTTIENSIPKGKQRQRKTYVSNNELRKTLRPKSNDKINYSMVQYRHKVINPVSKMRQMIKEEKESIKQSSIQIPQEEITYNKRKLTSKTSSILKNKRTKKYIQGNNEVQLHQKFPKPHHRAKNETRRRISIRDTDRFQFGIDMMRATKT